MYFVYIIKNIESDIYYKGLTNNINKRLHQHNAGQVKTTKNKFPLKLIHVEIFKTRREARKIEKFFKSGYEHEIIQELSSNF